MARRKSRSEVVQSSGYVFSDLKLPNADEKQTKVRLVAASNYILESQQLPKSKRQRN
jgi:hypothetical protein